MSTARKRRRYLRWARYMVRVMETGNGNAIVPWGLVRAAASQYRNGARRPYARGAAIQRQGGGAVVGQGVGVMTSTPSEADVQRVEHARRVLAEASGNMLTADWGTLYWIAQQVPPLLDVIDHIATMTPPVGVLGTEVHGYDNGIPVRTLHAGEKSCGCFITDVCDCYAPPQTWGWTK